VLDTASYSWEFVPIAGSTFTDVGTTACHTRIGVASVDVSPSTGSLTPGGTLQLAATPKDADGTPLTGRTVTWSTSNSAVATVSASGLVTAVAVGGPVTISATSEGKSGSAAITVSLTPIASVDVSPATGSVVVGGTLPLTATPKDANGNALTGRAVTWSTSDANLATVDASGVVTGKAAGGPVTITATSEGVNGTAAITVTPIPVATVEVTPSPAVVAIGNPQQFTATLKDANGNVLSGRTVTWGSSNENIATVDANGLVTGVATGGPVTITATSEGKSGTATMIVSPFPVATVDVTPAAPSIVVGTTVQLTATPKDADGNPLSGRIVVWTTSNANIATVSATGLVTGVSVGGPVTITATSEDKSGTASVTVTPVPIASITVTPPSATIALGATVQLTASAKDAAGNPLTGRAMTWATGNAATATVDANGLVTGRAGGGPVTISATAEGVTGTSAITVVAFVPVASVDVTPAAATILASGSVQLTATPRDATGNALTGRVVTWSSSAPGVAAVNSSGLVAGLAVGLANISATSEGVLGSAAITVQAAPGPPVIAGAGDIADCSRVSQEATAKLIDSIPGTVVVLGDLAYLDGSAQQFRDCYDPSWGRHKPRTKPTPGNHEYNAGSAAGAPGYFGYFGAAAGDPTKGYYSYDLGAWHLIVINNYVDMAAGSPQEQWLRADLAAHPNACTLAYWHEPRFSSGGNGSAVRTQPMWQALYDYGADVILNGHDHDYERFAPQTPTGVRDNVNGIREFVVGTGGNSLYTFPGGPIANSEVMSMVSYGVIKMTLWPTSYDWEFIPISGGTFTDRGSALCHTSTPVPNQMPIANTGGPYFSEGTAVLDGTQSRDPDNNTPLTYAWNLGDGTTANTPTVTHTYPAEGQYLITLTVTDAKGLNSIQASSSVTVANVAPKVNAGVDQSVVGGTLLNLKATFTDPGPTDNPWNYTITWGDGATNGGTFNTLGTPIIASHVYSTPGQYTARVTVTDKDGGAGSDDIIVKVLNPGIVQVFSGASNIASCGTNDDELTAQILDGLPGTVFALGDNVNPSGTAANFANCYTPTWGRHKARTRAVVGTHEYDVAGANAFYTYFKPTVGDSAKYYYSFDLGPYWHVVVLNNTPSIAYGAGSVQELWLKADLAANTKPCTIAMFHYPLFFSSSDPTWHTTSSVIALFNDVYQAHGEIVLNGQEFFYERFAPQDAGSSPDPTRGVREFQVGTGGYAVSMPTSIAANSEAVSASVGVLKLTLGPDSYIWDFIPAPGYTFTDHGSGNCH
jgi:uncharacterized protein YjdB/PKD repeat protein